MKENKYDDPVFFEQYSKMSRSEKGLEGAGEWYVLRQMLPDMRDKKVLDLGCGMGWHCRYVMENGAKSAIGIDISEKMIEKARAINAMDGIEYIRKPIEDVDYPAESFDIVISSLTLHYIESFESLFNNISKWLVPGGDIIFSVEHPVFTAYGSQEWVYDESGTILHWPVDNYFYEGKRSAIFLGEQIVKYHRTITSYINTLLKQGFYIKEIIEPYPEGDIQKMSEDMKNELRRPMMLLSAAEKK